MAKGVGMSSKSWRQLNFFDSQTISPSPEPLDQPHSITALATAHGTLVLGHTQGQITILNRSLQATRSWIAFPVGRVSLLRCTTVKGLLVSIGHEPGSSFPVLKLWDLHHEDKRTSSPHLVTHSTIQVGPRPHPVTTLALTATLLALGLADGTVLLYRNLVLHNSLGSAPIHRVLPKPRLVYTSPDPITGLNFNSTTLFILTTSKILTFPITGKSTPLLIDRIGASLGSSTINSNGKLVVGDDEAIYIYGQEGREACLAYDGQKDRLEAFGDYLVLSSENEAKLSLFDLDNKLVAFTVGFKDPVSHIWSEWGELFVLTAKGQLTRLVEQGLAQRLEMMFEKELYVLASNIAKRAGATEPELALIYQRYGDVLYSKGDFSQAVEQYIKTIGSVQPSIVIRKFLDAQRISNLTSYLQELHSRGVANADHTTLLLNCYTKLKDEDRLERFIKASTASDTPMFELETAIRVCRQAGYSIHALGLAKRYAQHADALRIMVEDREEWIEALRYIRLLGPLAAEDNLLRYGKPLLANVAQETTELMIDVCCGTPLIENQATDEGARKIPVLRQFFAFFIDQPQWFITFLETVAKRRWGESLDDGEDKLNSSRVKIDTSTKESEAQEVKADKEAVWGTLLELYLQSSNPTRALSLLQSARLGKYCEPSQALIVCLAHDFVDGIVLLYTRLNMSEEVVRLWLSKAECAEEEARLEEADAATVSAMEAIKDDAELVRIGLTFLSSGGRLNRHRDQLDKLLGLGLVEPIEVVEIMSAGPNSDCTLGDLKDYLAKHVMSERTEIEADRVLMEAYRKESEKKRRLINENLVVDKVIQTSRCGICSTSLELPAVHFMCQHSFHQRCLGELDVECVVCKASHRLVREAQRRREGMDEIKAFVEEVAVAEDSFGYIAGAFAKGLL